MLQGKNIATVMTNDEAAFEEITDYVLDQGHRDIEDYDDVEIRNCWRERVVNGNTDAEKLLDGIRYRARDNARTPMQWDDTENAGFTTGKPWLKVNPNYREINVKEALADADSVFYYMQRLIRMRKENEAAVYGDFKEYEPENELPFACSLKALFFRTVHHPMEKQGVDFWWIDWQQGNNSGIEGLDPLWVLNHYHYEDSRRSGKLILP